MKTQVFRGNLWKTLGKHMFSIENYRKHDENTSFPWEPMQNNMKAQVFRWNLWKTLRN